MTITFPTEFYYVNKGVWYVSWLGFAMRMHVEISFRALIMAQMALNVYASDQIFG